MSDSDEEKSHDPTQKRLDDARKKGETPRSSDLNIAAGYAGFGLVMTGFGAATFTGLGEVLLAVIAQAGIDSNIAAGPAAYGGLMLVVGKSIAPWFLAPALAALVSILAQRSLILAPEKIAPKLSRIDPIANARNKFGRTGLFEFGKSAVKLMLYGIVLTWFLAHNLDRMASAAQLPAGLAIALMMRLALEFLLIVILIVVPMGAGDYLWQYFDHIRKNRMSLQDLKDEHKQSEGDPHMKHQRRQRGAQIAANQMLADVPKADVVIVNPTHYAVALQWDRTAGGAPVCIGKGVDEIAARMREIAAENGVPLFSDPPTARALFATIEIGQQVQREHYRAVAAAIRFAEAMRLRAGRRL